MMLLTKHAFICRRGRPFGSGDPGDQDEDFGSPGGNVGDSGSTGGGGGGDWGSDGGEEGGYFGDLMGALWLWRALCVCSVLQVIYQTSTVKPYIALRMWLSFLLTQCVMCRCFISCCWHSTSSITQLLQQSASPSTLVFAYSQLGHKVDCEFHQQL